MLRRAFLAYAGAMALMGGAFAAEPLPPPYLPPPFIWDGFYVGGTAGYDPAWHHCDDLENLARLPETGVGCADQFRSYGFIGGGTLGYNWQAGSLVYGLETDFSAATNRSSTSLSTPGACNPNAFEFEPQKCGFGWQFSNSVDWLWTVRPRIGLAVDRTLAYFTAGFALGGVQNSLWSTGSCGGITGCNGVEPFFATTTGKTAIGYAVGGGLEYALDPNWSIKGEALYVNFDSRTVTFFPLIGTAVLVPQGPQHIRWDNSLVVVRAGLNYRFNWAPVPVVNWAPAPVVAKY